MQLSILSNHPPPTSVKSLKASSWLPTLSAASPAFFLLCWLCRSLLFIRSKIRTWRVTVKINIIILMLMMSHRTVPLILLHVTSGSLQHSGQAALRQRSQHRICICICICICPFCISAIYLVEGQTGLAVLDTIGNPLHPEVNLRPVSQQVRVGALQIQIQNDANTQCHLVPGIYSYGLCVDSLSVLQPRLISRLRKMTIIFK